ncbi:unnamed protein product [Symbiodinium sp. CCMP2592]|nr:unnamed protein product [Symbiodinium sp. CCMP2592]
MALLGRDFIFAFHRKDGPLGLQLRLLDGDQIVVTGVSGQLKKEVERRRQSGSLIVGQRVVLVGDLVLAVNGQSHFETVCNELRAAKALYFVIRRHAAALDLDLEGRRPDASSAVPAQSTADDLPPPPWAAMADMPAASSSVTVQSTEDDLRAPWAAAAQAPATSSTAPAQMSSPWVATTEAPAASSSVTVQSTLDDLRAPWAAAAQAPATSSTAPAQMSSPWVATSEAPVPAPSTADDPPAPWEVMAEAPAASSTMPTQSTADDSPAPWEVMAEAPAKEETTLSTMASETDDPLSQQMFGWEQRAPGEWFHPTTQESFNEGDSNSGWTKYLDENTCKPWFWHEATGRFFFA